MAAKEVVVRLELDDDLRKAISNAVSARAVDEHCWLSGDEDGGVDVQCRTCDLGGKPVAYYPGISGNPYPDVPTATGIFELYVLANKHVREHHRPA
jgi:hypothetical protein